MSSKREMVMLALRLPPEIEKRLDALAKKTGRSKSFYAREAILRHIEDLEDYHLAKRRLGRKAAPGFFGGVERGIGGEQREAPARWRRPVYPRAPRGPPQPWPR